MVFARWFTHMRLAIMFAEDILSDATKRAPLIQLYQIGDRVYVTVRT